MSKTFTSYTFIEQLRDENIAPTSYRLEAGRELTYDAIKGIAESLRHSTNVPKPKQTKSITVDNAIGVNIMSFEY